MCKAKCERRSKYFRLDICCFDCEVVAGSRALHPGCLGYVDGSVRIFHRLDIARRSRFVFLLALLALRPARGQSLRVMHTLFGGRPTLLGQQRRRQLHSRLLLLANALHQRLLPHHTHHRLRLVPLLLLIKRYSTR